MLPRVFERLEAGDPGDPQGEEGASWAGPFEAGYAAVDWSQSAREIHNQVRAWRHMFGAAEVEGPIAKLDGGRVKVLYGHERPLADPTIKPIIGGARAMPVQQPQQPQYPAGPAW